MVDTLSHLVEVEPDLPLLRGVAILFSLFEMGLQSRLHALKDETQLEFVCIGDVLGRHEEKGLRKCGHQELIGKPVPIVVNILCVVFENFHDLVLAVISHNRKAALGGEGFSKGGGGDFGVLFKGAVLVVFSKDVAEDPFSLGVMFFF